MKFVEEIRELELRLLMPETRRLREVADALISEEFVEFGSSGRIYRKADALAVLLAEPPGGPLPNTAEWRIVELSRDSALVTYRTPQSRRSSVWRREESGFRTVFHQGTPITERQESLDIVRAYFGAIEAKDQQRVRASLHPEVTQHEYPNALSKAGASRTLAGLLEGLARGAAVLSAERYEIEDALVDGDKVACRVRWRGTLAVEGLGKKPGEVLEARFGVFFKLKDGKVFEQHNYDCFSP